MGQHFAGEQALGALTFGVLESRMHIWASDLWKSDMIAYRSVGHSPALGSLALWVDLLPPLYSYKSSGKVVLERFDDGKSCLRKNVTSFAEGAKKCARHLLSGTLTFKKYRLRDPIKPVHGKRAVISRHPAFQAGCRE
jgi:hypothetical protein